MAKRCNFKPFVKRTELIILSLKIKKVKGSIKKYEKKIKSLWKETSKLSQNEKREKQKGFYPLLANKLGIINSKVKKQ